MNIPTTVFLEFRFFFINNVFFSLRVSVKKTFEFPAKKNKKKMANNNNLKEIICHNLNQALSMDKNLRENAEQQLNMLETNEGKYNDKLLNLV